MVKFIYLCMAFIALSFIATPIYFGVSGEKEKLQENLRNLVEILSKCALPDRTDDISFI